MSNATSRREFFTNATGFTGAALLAAHGFAGFHLNDDETIQLALVGCGGRGSGAVVDALSVKRGPMKLVAMADCFEDRLKTSHEGLVGAFKDGVDVPPERRFVGFDGYKRAMDCLKPGDIVILATPPAFRWVHFNYAIEKGLNVFMEKPVCVDGPTSRRMLELSKRADEKNLRVAVGLMSRHNRAMQELAARVQDGELGEILLQRGYRMQGTIVKFRSPPKPANISEVEYQLRRFHSFLWASGGAFDDFFIHIIDQLCWMKGAWPTKAQAVGGRHYRTGPDGTLYVDQNFDSYGVEYTYADGTTFFFDGRNIDGCDEVFNSFMHGTKGSAVVSSSGDCGMPSRIYSQQDMSPANLVWESKVAASEGNPYRNEWNDFVNAIRDGRRYNEVEQSVQTNLVCNMGRMAAHTGHPITLDQMRDCQHEFAPQVASLTIDSVAPLMGDAMGRYPVPQPGILIDREY